MQSVTLYLTVVVSPDTTSYPVLPINATNLLSTEVNESSPREAVKPSMAQDSTNTTRSTIATGCETLSPPTDLPSEMSASIPPAANRGVGMSPAEDSLHDADGAVTTSMNITRPTVATGSETPSSPTDRLPSPLIPPAAVQQAGMSPAENALHGAGEAMTTINLSKTWEGALKRIKWVMDTASSVAEVRCDVLFVKP